MRTWFQRLLAAALSAVAISLGGCGGGGGDAGDERREAEARQTVETLFRAMDRGDTDRICRLLSREARRAFVALVAPGEERGCAEVMADAAGFATKSGKSTRSDVAVRRLAMHPENRATAMVSVDGRVLRIEMVEVGDSWRFSSLGNPE